MNKEVVELIKNQLLGETSGHMANIPNNPMFYSIFCSLGYDAYNINDEFKRFIEDMYMCIKEKEKEEQNNDEVLKSDNRRRAIIKNIQIDSSMLMDYRKIESDIRKLQNEKQKELKRLAELKSPVLAEISSVKIVENTYSTSIEYTMYISNMKEHLNEDEDMF